MDYRKFPIFPPHLSEKTSTRATGTLWPGKCHNSQLHSSDNLPPIRSIDHFFPGNSTEFSQNRAQLCYTIDFHAVKQPSKQPSDFEKCLRSYFMKVNNTSTNVVGIKQSDSPFFLSFGNPLKKRKCFDPFLHRCFTTTTVNTSTNDDNSAAEMSFQNDGESLTHVNREGKANMVCVGDKEDTRRYSVGTATVKLDEKTFGLVKDNKMKKGDVINIAKLAGIMAAKQTANLIPLCHNIPLTSIKVDLELEEVTHSVVIEGKVKCFGKTGVEMEALTCVSVAALTVYDICKAVSKDIVITDIKLLEKDGGKSGYFVRNPRN